MNPHFKFGMHIAAAKLGVDADGLAAARGQAQVMDSPEAVPFNRELCKIAAAAFADDTPSPAGVLFHKLANVSKWDAGFNVFTDCVKRALAKQASMLATLPFQGGGGAASDAMRSLVATGALGGAGLGSLAFLLARNATQSSAKNAEILEKVRAFKQLRRDIEEDMASDDALRALVPKKKERYNV